MKDLKKRENGIQQQGAHAEKMIIYRGCPSSKVVFALKKQEGFAQQELTVE